MQLASPPLSYAITKIDLLISDEIKLLRGVKKELRWLKVELSIFQTFLKVAETRSQNHNPMAREWLNLVEGLDHDILRLLRTEEEEESGASTSHSLKDRFLMKFKAVKPVHLHITAKKIKRLKGRIDHLKQLQKDFNISTSDGNQGGETSNAQHDARHKRLARQGSTKRQLLVGFSDVYQRLRDELTKEKPPHVISIYGMGGLGKTALAQELYNSNEVTEKFPSTRAWVTANRESTKDLFRIILSRFDKSASKEDLQKMDERELKEKLRDFLQKSKYLLVLDDVWESSTWENLMGAIPENELGSSVLITTRNKAATVRDQGAKNLVHELRFMTPEESWELLCMKVPQMTDRQEHIARTMLRKCGGLPLAIEKLGKLFSQLPHGLDHWEDLEKRNIWKQLREQDTNEDRRELQDLFDLSYYQKSFDYCFRPCFLYMSMFPENYEFDVQELICMWIAERMITPEQHETLEHAAQRYVRKLNERCLVLVARMFWEEMAECRVYDLLRNLAIDNAIGRNLFTIFPHKKNPYNFQLCRKHAIHDEIPIYLSGGHVHKDLETLIFFNPEPRNFIHLLELKFKQLEVLDLSGSDLSSNTGLANIIDGLNLLFLGLNETFIKEIPRSIASSTRLQTLLAKRCDGCSLPEEIKNLRELRHLHGSFTGPFDIEALTSLQTLSIVTCDQLSVINNESPLVNNLRKLTMRCSLINFPFVPIITKFKELEDLILSSYDYTPGASSSQPPPPNHVASSSQNHVASSPQMLPLSSCDRLLRLCLDGALVRRPNRDEFPRNLTRLILSKSKLNEDPMETLELLPNLSSLELIDAYEGDKMVCKEGGFPELKVLRLTDLKNLQEWEVREGAMPKITGLRIQGCNRLTVPERFGHLSDPGESASISYIPGYSAP